MQKPALAFIYVSIGVGISNAEILFVLQCFALAVPTGYAAWKWLQDYKRSKKESREP